MGLKDSVAIGRLMCVVTSNPAARSPLLLSSPWGESLGKVTGGPAEIAGPRQPGHIMQGPASASISTSFYASALLRCFTRQPKMSISSADYFHRLFSLSGKTALITGSGRGVGFAYARALAHAGADIVLVLHPSESEEAVDKISALGVKAHLFQADLCDRDQVRELFPRVWAAGIVVDIFVNNAGIAHREPISTYPEEKWYDIIQVNLSAGFVLGQAFACDVVKRGAKGKIINTSSVGGFLASKNTVAYTASKHGINALTKSFSTEFAGTGINVNAIAPGYTITELTRNNLEKNGTSFLKRIPIGRFAETSDLEGAVLFLASAASDYVSGQVLAVDGGRIVSDFEADLVTVDAGKKSSAGQLTVGQDESEG
jgi:2-deoxy-D-gluconate 3-dehydrogenase